MYVFSKYLRNWGRMIWCTATNVIHQANLYSKESKNNHNIFIGISSDEWKQWLHNHRQSFCNPKLKFQAAHSKKSCELREKDQQIDSKTIGFSQIFSNFEGRWGLCLQEKITIIKFGNANIVLDERNELISKCYHRSTFKFF